MALTDEGMVMPVQPLNGYGNNGGGFGELQKCQRVQIKVNN